MIVTLYRPIPPDGPWILLSQLGDIAFLHPPETVSKRMDGLNGEVEAVMDDAGEWLFCVR